jgi:hypothetical protein
MEGYRLAVSHFCLRVSIGLFQQFTEFSVQPAQFAKVVTTARKFLHQPSLHGHGAS